MQSEQRTPNSDETRDANRIEQRSVPLSILLSDAIVRQELKVHYQPQYEMQHGVGCGVEALARWTLPDGEEIPPTVFIAIAERTALIRPLGNWVLQHACETVFAWGEMYGREPTLSVNVSTQQITEEFC